MGTRYSLILLFLFSSIFGRGVGYAQYVERLEGALGGRIDPANKMEFSWQATGFVMAINLSGIFFITIFNKVNRSLL